MNTSETEVMEVETEKLEELEMVKETMVVTMKMWRRYK